MQRPDDMTPKKILFIALIPVLAFGGWLFYYFSDKMVIQRQFVELAQELGKEEQEQPIQMALKMGKVKNMLATNCLATVPEKNYSEELEQGLVLQYLIYYRNRYTRIAVNLEDLQITLADKEQAVVQATAQLRRQMPGQMEPPTESQRVEFFLLKGDQRWLIRKAVLPASLINDHTLP